MTRILGTIFFFFAAAFSWGQSSWLPDVSIDGARTWGGDLRFTWGPFALLSGAGYEKWEFGRDQQTGDPVSGKPEDISTLNADLIGRYTWDLDEVKVWTGVGTWGWGNLGLGPATSGMFDDLNGNLIGFGQVGLTRDRRSFNAHRVESGYFGEFFVEYGPSFAAVRQTDYYKISFHSSYFLPLIDLPGPRQRFAAEVGFRAWARWIDGKHVPFALQEPNDVRGYWRLLDSQFSSVFTSELRVHLSSLWNAADIVPLFFTFVDTGWYDGFAGAAAQSRAHGYLLGTGAGIGLSMFGKATPTLTVGVPWTDGESSFWWKLNFNLRF